MIQTAYAATQFIELPSDWIPQTATTSAQLFSGFSSIILVLLGIGIFGFIVRRLTSFGN